MNKQQRDYLVRKMSEESANAKREFAKSNPTAHAEADVIAALERCGFVFSDYGKSYAARYVSLPQTTDMAANEAKIKDFNAKVDKALLDAKDEVYLGGSDAVAMLRNFQETLLGLIA